VCVWAVHCPHPAKLIEGVGGGGFIAATGGFSSRIALGLFNERGVANRILHVRRCDVWCLALSLGLLVIVISKWTALTDPN
jgi:hypothetical protein